MIGVELPSNTETQISYIVDNTSPFITSRIPLDEVGKYSAMREGGGRGRTPSLGAND